MASAATNVTPIKEPPTGLALLRAPFPDNQISKLPKESRAQIDARKADKNLMEWKCKVCGGMHHKNAVHLDYVGHAALTDRLLDTDPAWAWEPVALTPDGLPAFDHNGGLWVRLTVLGVTRLGYGDADGKSGGNAVKEAIGDAMRNAAMRFGAALDLWHKGDLHVEDNDGDEMPDHEWARLTGLVEATHSNVAALLKHLAINLPNNDLSKLNKEQYPRVIEALNAKLAKIAKAESDAKAKAAPVEPAKPVQRQRSEFAEILDDDIAF